MQKGIINPGKADTFFEVSLNFVEKPEKPHDFPITFDRAQSLFRKLRHPSNKEMMETYYDKIEDLKKKGYMFQLGPLPEVMARLTKDFENDFYFLPSNMLYQQKSLSTRTRLTYDASSLTRSVLDKGLNYLPKIFEILIKFRAKPIALAGDIREMYLSIRLSEKCQRHTLLLHQTKEDSNNWMVLCSRTVIMGFQIRYFFPRVV